MRIDAWDSVFVRARRRDVHAWLAGLGGWHHWWPGLHARPYGDGLSVVLHPPGRRRRPQRYTVRRAAVRADLGLKLRYDGDLNGEAEFYYLDELSGCVVHYLVRAQAGGLAPVGRRVARLTADHRAAARCGLNALKDRLEAGREPGAEPEPALLADQRLAIAEFRARVAAGQRRRTTAGPPEPS
ncbi:MAG: hypothetical protein M3415_07715 [Actinomycetota bacterium]|jgi:hypothetical protein|nr:hypothetical protein [Actinomycetota bacterium]